MAVVTTKSAGITNRDATPAVLNNAGTNRGTVKRAFGKCALAATDQTGSKLLCCEVPSNAYVIDVRYVCGAAGGSCAMDVGAYRNTRDGAAAVDADFFATAVTLVSAIVGFTSVINESTTNTIAKREQPLWQALGLSSDPKCTFDIVGTLTADSAAAVDVGLEVLYSE